MRRLHRVLTNPLLRLRNHGRDSGEVVLAERASMGRARGWRRARPMQPSQDKRRPAQRTRPRESTPTPRTAPLGWRVEEARERISSRTEIEGERTGGNRMSVKSHHSHEGSNEGTRSEQNTGRGLGQQPRALQNRQLSVSAPKLALCERDRTCEAAQ